MLALDRFVVISVHHQRHGSDRLELCIGPVRPATKANILSTRSGYRIAKLRPRVPPSRHPTKSAFGTPNTSIKATTSSAIKGGSPKRNESTGIDLEVRAQRPPLCGMTVMRFFSPGCNVGAWDGASIYCCSASPGLSRPPISLVDARLLEPRRMDVASDRVGAGLVEPHARAGRGLPASDPAASQSRERRFAGHALIGVPGRQDHPHRCPHSQQNGTPMGRGGFSVACASAVPTPTPASTQGLPEAGAPTFVIRGRVRGESRTPYLSTSSSAHTSMQLANRHGHHLARARGATWTGRRNLRAAPFWRSMSAHFGLCILSLRTGYRLGFHSLFWQVPWAQAGAHR
jgi:hypothetical protein